MSLRKIIAIDIDDVIADSTESLRNLVNERTGKDLTKEHYRIAGDYWGYYERVWQEHALDVDFASLNKEMVYDQSHVPILAGAALVLSELSKTYELVIVTSRDPSWEKATKAWLEENCPGMFKEIRFTRRKTSESKSKGELCLELGASWLVDDNPEHCESAREQGVGAVLFGEYGWHHSAAPDVPICRDWPAVLEYFDGQS